MLGGHYPTSNRSSAPSSPARSRAPPLSCSRIWPARWLERLLGGRRRPRECM